MSAPLVIIPILASAESSDLLLRPIAGRSSLERTLASAMADLPNSRIVVTTNDTAIAERATVFSDKVTVHDRQITDYVPALVEVLDQWPADLVVVLEATHAFRPAGLVGRTADNLRQRYHLDSVVCVQRFKANLWRQDPDGTIAALSEGGARRDTTYFQEMIGLALATRPSILRDGYRLGDAVGFELVDQVWALVDIRDETSLAVAELVANNLPDLISA
jgi:hypothetical protein